MDKLAQQIHYKAMEIMATVHINDSDDIESALRMAIMAGMSMQVADTQQMMAGRDEKKMEDARDIAIEMKERRMEP